MLFVGQILTCLGVIVLMAAAAFLRCDARHQQERKERRDTKASLHPWYECSLPEERKEVRGTGGQERGADGVCAEVRAAWQPQVLTPPSDKFVQEKRA